MEIKRQSVAFNILRNFKETEHIMTVENVVNTINDNFNKGLIDELTVEEAFGQLDNLLEKGHKYFKREGSPGNYKYYYTEEQYNKEKGKTGGSKENKSSDTTEEDSKKENLGIDQETYQKMVKEYSELSKKYNSKGIKHMMGNMFQNVSLKKIQNFIDSQPAVKTPEKTKTEDDLSPEEISLLKEFAKKTEGEGLITLKKQYLKSKRGWGTPSVEAFIEKRERESKRTQDFLKRRREIESEENKE